MIDARVEDSIKQHFQKMNWLHRDEAAAAAAEVIPGQTGAADVGPGIGFTLPKGQPPQAQEVLAPVLEAEKVEAPVPLEEVQLNSILPVTDSAVVPAKGGGTGEGGTVQAEVESVQAVDILPTQGEGQESKAQNEAGPPLEKEAGKEVETKSTPSKDGTPV